jgi:hypothetical protein
VLQEFVPKEVSIIFPADGYVGNFLGFGGEE